MKSPKELIKYRMEKAWGTYEDAKNLWRKDNCKTKINLIYVLL